MKPFEIENINNQLIIKINIDSFDKDYLNSTIDSLLINLIEEGRTNEYLDNTEFIESLGE